MVKVVLMGVSNDDGRSDGGRRTDRSSKLPHVDKQKIDCPKYIKDEE